MKKHLLPLLSLLSGISSFAFATPLPDSSELPVDTTFDASTASLSLVDVDSLSLLSPADSLSLDEDEMDFTDHWDTDMIHAYKYIDMGLIPSDTTLQLVDSLHHFCSPVIGAVRSRYMFRRRRPHKGTDIPLKVGDPVRAAFDGKVRVVKSTRQTGGYGNLVVIRHPNGLETYYGHLSRHAVLTNDVVKAGDTIGFGGSTGRSTGPHLHFEVRYMGQPFDSERLIDFATGQLRTETFNLHKHYFSIYSHYGQTDEESLEASKRKIHTIRRGDTLGGLARKYHTTITNICRLNKISTRKTLRIGERLIVR